MTALIGSPHPLSIAQVAALTGRHLHLLSQVDHLARGLEAGMPIDTAVAELREMSATARAAA